MYSGVPSKKQGTAVCFWYGRVGPQCTISDSAFKRATRCVLTLVSYSHGYSRLKLNNYCLGLTQRQEGGPTPPFPQAQKQRQSFSMCTVMQTRAVHYQSWAAGSCNSCTTAVPLPLLSEIRYPRAAANPKSSIRLEAYTLSFRVRPLTHMHASGSETPTFKVYRPSKLSLQLQVHTAVGVS